MSREQRLITLLNSLLSPETLVVEDESNLHNVPVGAESHFKIIAVSVVFNETSRIQRHRLVNSHLSDEFSTGLHALSLHLYTPDEWRTQAAKSHASPVCLGGKHKERS